jgi:hypothetical protein
MIQQSKMASSVQASRFFRKRRRSSIVKTHSNLPIRRFLNLPALPYPIMFATFKPLSPGPTINGKRTD